MAESTDRRNPGWYVGVGAFWLIAAWLVTVGLSSIIPQIFPPETAEASVPVSDCASSLQALQEELLLRSAEAAKAPGDDRQALDTWLNGWDERVQALSDNCAEPVAEASAELSRVRHALRDMLRKLDREQGPRLHHIHTLLGGATHATAH